MNDSRMRQGFTLIEMVLVTSIIGIISATALPRLRGLLDSIAARGAARDAAAMIGAARTLAMTRGTLATLDVDTARGILTLRAGSTVLETRDESPSGARFSVTRASVSFVPLGIAYGAANLTLVARRGSAAETVTVSRLGRVRQ